jgi:hypothetical protein
MSRSLYSGEFHAIIRIGNILRVELVNVANE